MSTHSSNDVAAAITWTRESMRTSNSPRVAKIKRVLLDEFSRLSGKPQLIVRLAEYSQT